MNRSKTGEGILRREFRVERAGMTGKGQGCKALVQVMAVLLLLGGGFSSAWAAYITDQIPVTLRRGPGNEYRILKSLTSPASIEILEDNDNYFKVRTADGTEGYILKQYVIRQEPSAVIAARLQREQTVLRKKVDELRQQNQDFQALQAENRTLLQQTETELRKVQGDYDKLRKGAQNITETMAERDRLQQENEEQLQKIAALEKENRYLWRNNILRWFFAGVGVLCLGWLLGRRPPRRTRSF
ncbi:SH3 domain protein [Syntrophotalea carbinolica DSM 2380]|uniref:SH3 domain protein n=1 Tax=Syntrophotalea carbinolica (strain DSM 2380 / NBRC 103641 / GraBd1) TaxID=338963 RepID=Q3A785_SYNC1|nr:TIGR04211 family SH3 domain-containing protein [Syntrophotalea carbinolica]ABA87759.1 SH3 domain protein [Syntrophotalea carbinolica DSM 2380]